MSREEIFALYRLEIDHADSIVAPTPAEAAPACWPETIFPAYYPQTLGTTVLRVITEARRHAGHLDAVLEAYRRPTLARRN